MLSRDDELLESLVFEPLPENSKGSKSDIY